MVGRTARRGDLPAWAVLAVLAAIVGGIYGQSAGFDYVFDDEYYVLGAAEMGEGLTARTVRWAFTSRDYGNWFPLTRLSLLADAQLFGLRPGPSHLVNALLHLAGAWFLFAAMAAATGRRPASAALAALWAAHPLQVESVAWVTERSMLLATLFLWLALWAYLRHVRRPGPGRYLLVVAGAVLSLLAKPIAVALPALLLLLDWWPLGRMRAGIGRAGARLLILEKAPLVVLGAAFGVQAILSQAAAGAMATLEALTATQRAGAASLAAAWYLLKAAWPSGLCVYYPLEGVPALWWRSAAAVALIAVLSLAAVRVRRTRPQALFGWLWFAATILPLSGLLQAGAQATADRYAYIPLAGLLVAASSFLPAGRWRASGAVAVAILLCLSAASYRQAGFWRDDLTLFTRAEAIGGSESWIVHDHLGGAYERVGDWDAAERHHRAALRLAPGLAFTHNALGETLARRGELVAAETLFREALRINPGLGNAGLNLSAARECAAGGEGAACFDRLRPRREGVPPF